MRRPLKILSLVVGIFVVILVVGGVLVYNTVTYNLNFADYASFADLPLNTWTRVNLSNQTRCSDNSDYYMYTRRGSSDNLIVHFSGGGAAWDAETNAQPISITNLSGYYFPYIWPIQRAILGGIFQHDNPDNPFADWNIVFIPYCTADFHIGNATVPYPQADGSSGTLHHRGAQNVTEALAWVYETFDAPEKLLVSGDSAGGFGSIFWTPTVAKHYSNSDVYQLADGAYLETTLWPEIVDFIWNADTEAKYGFTAGSDLAGDAYLQYAATTPPNVTYLHINTLYDGTLIRFGAKLNDVPNDSAYREVWSAGMRESMREVDASDLPYYFFVTDHGLDAQTGLTPHTSISSAPFFAMESGGTFLSDWLRRIVIEGERFSVGGELLEAGA